MAVCGVDDGQVGSGSTETSCREGGDAVPLMAGIHYAMVTSYRGDSLDHLLSPEARFMVPYRLGFGCSPLQHGCRAPGVHSFYWSVGDDLYHWPHSQIVVNGWTNGSRATIRYTIRRGHEVLVRLQRSLRADTYFSVTSALYLYRVPGLQAGVRLRCTIAMTSGETTIRHTVTIQSGAGPKRGAKLGC